MHDSVRSCALFLDISAKHNGERRCKEEGFH
ncbi:hypothetical protein T05_5789 [Trichinella murrelli]|uniref:Uncharacterized protein n=1 Tax=Trichinella murrelli TaxID=144512 RepID=A0A0V0SS94_9BILA|nr:hypothetical protein T05_5789 [Trichinella murrelli]